MRKMRRTSALARLCFVAIGFSLSTEALLQGTKIKAQEPSDSRPVTLLVSDSCPAVLPGTYISLEWNPGFDHAGVVTGLHMFRATFYRKSKNGTLQTYLPLTLGGVQGTFAASSNPNGFFKIQLKLPREIAPGAYYLTEAKGSASTAADYTGAAITMTNSPSTARFCFRVTTQNN